MSKSLWAKSKTLETLLCQTGIAIFISSLHSYILQLLCQKSYNHIDRNLNACICSVYVKNRSKRQKNLLFFPLHVETAL
ncbi:MAG: hypothetical protein DRP65_10250 [Planctomycetota bacterium]|nr:MAG: hypothetical protein DRP65_10250 [Planctomycetota bacterium]